jgi:hypothetical protein
MHFLVIFDNINNFPFIFPLYEFVFLISNIQAKQADNVHIVFFVPDEDSIAHNDL